MAAYSDTVEDDGNAEATTVSALKTGYADYTERAEVRSSLLSTQLSASVVVVDDANGADLHFQFDDVQGDANAEAVVHNERRDLLASVVSSAYASAAVERQVRTKTEPLVIEDASGDDPIVRAGRRLLVTLQENGEATASLLSQKRQSSVSLTAAAQAQSIIASALLHAADTIVSDAQSTGGEPNFFMDSAYGESAVVRATLRVRTTITEDANAEATLVSDALARLFRDTIEADAHGDSSIESDRLNAVQSIVNDVDAVDELLNVVSDEAWVFNSWTLAFSRYTRLGVNDAHDIGGTPLFAAPQGLHEFSGTDFEDGLVQFGLSNMGAMTPKRMRAVYVTTAGRGVVKLATFHGLQGVLQEAKYITPTRESAVPINRRISPARGHQGQYWGFRVEVTSGRQVVTRIHVLPLVTGRNL